MRYCICHRMPSASHVRTQACKLVRSAARPMLTLERLPQRASSLDEELWNTGAFDAQVVPDLPAATSLSVLVAQWMSGKALQNARSGNQGELDGPGPRNHGAVAPHVVATVACQLRSRRTLEELIRTRCAQMGGSSSTLALLLVSGGHPARRLPLLPRMLPSSLDTLAMAAQLRASQQLPGDLQLWAVANPNTERSAELVARKVELGAQAILTQPPLAWSRFEAWWEDVERRGIQNECKILIGSGCISSPGNLAFWLALADARGVPEAEQQLARFLRASKGGKESFQKYAADWNEEQLRALMTLPGVAGIHFMPLTNAARRMALGLVSGDGAVMSRSIAGSHL